MTQEEAKEAYEWACSTVKTDPNCRCHRHIAGDYFGWNNDCPVHGLAPLEFDPEKMVRAWMARSHKCSMN